MMGDVTAADAVADFFLLKQDREAGDSITHLKLQKLVYYVQAWHAAATGKRAFPDQFKAWKDGPVVPRLYHRFKEHGDGLIDASAILTDPACDLPQSVRYAANEVYKDLGGLSGSQLRKRTHDEAPWKEAYGDRAEGTSCNEPITISAMEAFYRKVLGADFIYSVNIADAFDAEPEVEKVSGYYDDYVRITVPVSRQLRNDVGRRLEIESAIHNVIKAIAPQHFGAVAIRYRTEDGPPKTLSRLCGTAA